MSHLDKLGFFINCFLQQDKAYKYQIYKFKKQNEKMHYKMLIIFII